MKFAFTAPPVLGDNEPERAGVQDRVGVGEATPVGVPPWMGEQRIGTTGRPKGVCVGNDVRAVSERSVKR